MTAITLRPLICRAVVAAAVLVLSFVSPARAATFSVDPIVVSLPRGDASASVAVTNQSQQKLRLQVSGFAWQQKPSGEIALSPTDDLVFFPPLLTLEPGETKRIRIGVSTASSAVEKSYRVFMEELPSLESVTQPKAAAVVIRMKVGIPVFVSPNVAATKTGEVRDVAIAGNTLSFDVANTGNSHFSIQEVVLNGTSTSGASVYTQAVSGWYVLPGGTRHYSVTLPKGKCTQLHSLKIGVKADGFGFDKTVGDLTKECSGSGT
jgi:fimbrial chaperone protein